MVYDRWRNPQVHEGLTFSVRLTASDLYSAMKKSLPTVLPLMGMLAVAHSTAIDNPRVLFGLDLETRRRDRQFGQVIYGLPSIWLKRRSFDRDTFVQIWDNFARPAGPGFQSAINSAMYHLRKSYNAMTLIDEFLELYGGLESLNSALQEKYNLPTTEVRECSCGRKTSTPISSGIKYAVVSLAGKSTKDWNAVRKTRVDIVHRHGALPNVNTGLYDHVLIARQALSAAVFDLQNLSINSDRPRIPIQEPSAVLISASLKNTSAASILDVGPVPQFEVQGTEELVPATPGPMFKEPFAANLYLKLRNFNGECDPNLETRIWTGRYYDLPQDAEEHRKTQFIAKLFQ
jgi:hypothetical protein